MLSTSSKELGNRLQTPTLIGCIFLRIKLLRISSFRFSSLRSAKPSILAQFLSNWQNFFSFLLQQHYQLGSTAFCRASNYTSLFTAANSKPENFSNHSQQPTQPSTRGFSPPPLVEHCSVQSSPPVYTEKCGGKMNRHRIH